MYEEALSRCERPVLTGLLEDLHRCADGAPPAPSVLLPGARPYLPPPPPPPFGPWDAEVPPGRLALNTGGNGNAPHGVSQGKAAAAAAGSEAGAGRPAAVSRSRAPTPTPPPPPPALPASGASDSRPQRPTSALSARPRPQPPAAAAGQPHLPQQRPVSADRVGFAARHRTAAPQPLLAQRGRGGDAAAAQQLAHAAPAPAWRAAAGGGSSLFTDLMVTPDKALAKRQAEEAVRAAALHKAYPTAALGLDVYMAADSQQQRQYGGSSSGGGHARPARSRSTTPVSGGASVRDGGRPAAAAAIGAGRRDVAPDVDTSPRLRLVRMAGPPPRYYH